MREFPQKRSASQVNWRQFLAVTQWNKVESGTFGISWRPCGCVLIVKMTTHSVENGHFDGRDTRDKMRPQGAILWLHVQLCSSLGSCE
eukprot:4560821-Amphidinium_carterae.1